MKKLSAALFATLFFAAPMAALADVSATARAESASPAVEEKAPELPKTEAPRENEADEAGAKEGQKAEVTVPEGEPEVKKESVAVVQKKYGHFRWGNFFLGALGGAALTAGVGIPSGAANGNGSSLDGAKIGILAGAGAVGGGLLSVLLGATSPLPVTPPDMSWRPERPYAESAKQIVFSMQF